MRQTNDFYPTDSALFLGLKNILLLEGFLKEEKECTILSPCSGDNRIVDSFPKNSFILNDLFPKENAKVAYDFCYDALDPAFWEILDRDYSIDWVIENPPYFDNFPKKLLDLAFNSKVVGIALLLRLTFIEPVKSRRNLYLDHLRFFIPINPRSNYSIGKGTDNVSSAWFVWYKNFSWKDLGLQSPFCPLVDWKKCS